jgi:uncharacterized protein (PEP-CTERM system associated)
MSCPARQHTRSDLRRRLFRRRTPVLSAIAGGLALMPAAAAAQLDLGLGTSPRPWFDLRNVFTELRLDPSVSTGLTYTDNVDFEADARDDLILFVRPRANLIARARRLNTAIDYAFSLEYSSDEEGFRVEQISGSSLQSANSFEVVDNIFFVEANAAISRELIDNTDTQAAGVESEQTDNFATVQRYLVRPILRYQFDDFVVSETSASVGYVDAGSEEEAVVTYTAAQTFSSGPDFTTFQWNWDTRYLLSTGGDETEGDGGGEDEFRQFNSILSGQLFVLPRYSLIGSVGYEEIEDDGLEDEPDGVVWDVGFEARPNRRLTVSATFGRRFEEDTYTLDARYQIGPGTLFQARFNRFLETQETQLLNDLSFLGVDEEGAFIDTRTGLPPADDIELFGLEDETFTTSRLTADLVLDRGRNSFRFNGVFEEREIEELIAEGEDDAETVYGAGASWTRQLNRDLTGSLSLDYRFTDFAGGDTGREDDLITVRSRLTRNLGQGFSGAFNYVFRRQVSTFDEEDATENTVSLTLTKTF